MRCLTAVLIVILTVAPVRSDTHARITRADFVDFSFSTPTSSVNFALRNVGSTDATNVTLTATVSYFRDGSKVRTVLGSHTFSKKSLPPVSVKAKFFPEKINFPLSADELAEIETGKGQMKVIGTLTYETGAGAVNMPFCYKYDFPKGIRGCSTK